MGGFSEHDVLRSNQIREGELTRMDALKLVEKDNLPRWSSIEWYCKTIDLDFVDALHRINESSKFYYPAEKILVEA